ncbi:MAG: response regulator transcription factor [Flavobacteriales bacterium]|nr:response regulator transcription factor [Flavobacteriales bacterium]
MIRAIIVDDEEDARKTLRVFVNQYCPKIELIAEADGVQDAYRKIMAHEPDLVFLDIQMDDGTGFDLLAKFRNPSFGVIFTTAFDEFAIKAFKFSAIDYLLKPIDPDELIEAVSKVDVSKEDNAARLQGLMENKGKTEMDRLTLSSQEGLTFVKLENIMRLESDSNYTHFFLTTGEKITVPKSLKEYEAVLPVSRFFRTHQSHIVNLNYVKKYIKEDGGYVLMEDGSEVLVARRRKEEFIAVLTGQ